MKILFYPFRSFMFILIFGVFASSTVLSAGSLSKDAKYLITRTINCLPASQRQMLKRPDIFAKIMGMDIAKNFNPKTERQRYFQRLALSGNSKIQDSDKDFLIKLIDITNDESCSVDLRKLNDPNLQQVEAERIENRRKLIVKIAKNEATYLDVKNLIDKEGKSGEELTTYFRAIDEAGLNRLMNEFAVKFGPSIMEMMDEIDAILEREFDFK